MWFMRKKCFSVHWSGKSLFSQALFFLSLSLGWGAGTVCAAEYSLAVVPQFDSRKIEETWAPIITAIEKGAGVKLVLRGNVSIPEFEGRLYAGDFDFAYMNPYHFVRAFRSQKYRALVRDHGEMLQGVIVVRKDSPIARVEELDGKRVAMPAPNALGAALIPRAEFSRKFKIKPEIVYVRSHSSVYRNVVAGVADAGGGIESTFDAESEAIRSQLRILYRTLEVPPHPLAVHPRVDRRVADRVVKAILDFAQTAEGKNYFASVPMSKPGPATTNEYLPLEALKLDEFFVK